VDDAVRDEVGGAVGGAVRDAVGDEVDGAVRGAVRDAVDDAVRDEVGGAVGGAVRGAVRDAVGDAVRDAVDDAVRDEVGGAVGGAVGDEVDGAVRGAVRDAVGGAVRDAVDGEVGGAVGGAVIRKAIGSLINSLWYRYLGGQFWVGGWYWGAAYTSFFRDVCDLELPNQLWARGQAYEDTIRSACWWFPHRDFIMVCERPTVIKRELADPTRPRGWGSHRLHSLEGPAVGFKDGWGVYAVHGVRVPAYVIEQPEKITVEGIERETNAEVRRVMIDRYGVERFLTDAGAMVAHADLDQYDRPRRLLVKPVDGDEPIVMVEVTNSSPEPEGYFKKYMLRVDPRAYGGRASRECHAAIASTWRRKGDTSQLMFRTPEDYRPQVET
jgi:Arc/MetJ family transcription regulator